jgi:outer membrane translocation and assembly module TamA
MWDGPIVGETRALREQAASHYHHDMVALGEYFKTKRAKDAKKLILQAVQSTQKAQQQPHGRPTVVGPKRQSVSV